jgi:hypothetical protein
MCQWKALSEIYAHPVQTYTPLFDVYDMLERGHAFGGELFSIARTPLRAGDELPKPNGIRLRECSDAALPGLLVT